MTAVVREPADFRRACDEARGRGQRVGLVPTMGALHAGHLSLIDEAKARADFIAVTIFVNPLQFGEGEDLDRYPRTMEADLGGCRGRDVDVVFAPDPEAMYPDGFQTQ
ncbi:MAG: pantoate--beta-alanine ligase, partial [Polyangiales bacterium]